MYIFVLLLDNLGAIRICIHCKVTALFCSCFFMMKCIHSLLSFQSWEQQMKTGHDQGRLVLLQNLDPEYTSGDVEVKLPHFFKSSFDLLSSN